MWAPNYYNTFINPTQPQQFVPTQGGQTVSGTLNGSGPSNNFQPSQYRQYGGGAQWNGQNWMQPQQQSSYGDQGGGKYGYGSGQNYGSAQRNAQSTDQLNNVALGVLNQGLTGQAAIDAINQQMGYDTGAVWDQVRGNIDIGTGGPNGMQYDRSGSGQYGAHSYNDAGMPQMSTGPSYYSGNGQDPNAWRRMNYMRQHQRPMYGPNLGNQYQMGNQQDPWANIYEKGGFTGKMGGSPGYSYLQGTGPTYQPNYGSMGGWLNQPMFYGSTQG
jgi:hypothetical protein